MTGKIVIKGARVHNLKNIDLEIPRDQFVVITGVSGSGKSSLAFDTIFAEGQRRYLESLTADARQLLQQLEKPDVDSIDGLSPAIAVQQKPGAYTARSTVGTITEIYDYLRLLFARVGKSMCVQCGREIVAHTTEQIVDQLTALPPQTRIVIMAPIVSQASGDRRERLEELRREGFVRVKIDGQIHELSDEITLDPLQPHDIDLVIDRLAIRNGIEKRLADSLETASRFGNRIIKVEIQTAGEHAPQEMIFSQKLACVHCGSALPQITPQLFSFNSPQGACPACNGLGVDLRRRGESPAGSSSEVRTCKVCKGSRLRPESLAVKIGGKNIAEIVSLNIIEGLDFFRDLELTSRERVVGQRTLNEIGTRLHFLIDVGLEYLTLDRPSMTLSGGEAQRVRLATHIGSGLAGVLYILDEPSIGLHQRDNARLVALLKQLQRSGNTVLVVEHDRETILAADRVIDMGPGAGVEGGEVIAEGTPQELMRNPRSLTGQYLSGQMSASVVGRRKTGTDEFLTIKGARLQNLKNITVEIPVGVTTCITGVSGAGKSTLVMEILFPAVASRLQRTKMKTGALENLIGWERFERVIGVDQRPIGRTPRSNPATYTGAYDHIRDLFAQLPEARVRGYQPERFSFNLRGGRCEACKGDGVVRVDMYFLPDVYVTCDVCKGRRYNRETLDIRYKGFSIADILDLTVNQAAELFSAVPAVSEKLRALHEVGLGYIKLGQRASTLSGGESQRVKLARELARRSTGKSLYVMDEPTTGLHFADIKKLLELLERLTAAGNTVVIIEHNLDVIKSADFVIELGPEGGAKGGEIVAAGTPEEVASSPNSPTGQYLRHVLNPRSTAIVQNPDDIAPYP